MTYSASKRLWPSKDRRKTKQDTSVMMHGSLKTRHVLQRIARAGVFFCILISPWFFGSAEPWAYYLVCVPALAGLGAWLFSVVCYPDAEIHAPALSVALIALILFMAFQSMPLPAFLAKALNPLAGEAQVVGVELVQSIDLDGTGESGDGHASISASAAATKRSLFLFASYLAVFFVTANACRHWHHLRRLAGLMIGSSFFMAVIAVSHKLSGSRLLLWFHKARYGGNMFGPFTNRNHYAAYMALAFGVTLGLILATNVLLKGRASGGWQDKFRWASSKKVNLLGLLLFVAAFIAGSVAFSCSRAGVVSLVTATGMVGIVVGLRRDGRGRARIIMSVVLVAVGLLLWLGWQPVLQRFESLWTAIADPIANTRTLATIDTMRIFSACPMFGCGFGCFQYVFPMFMREELQFGRWVHAHNDWAQLSAEGGLLGSLLVLIALGLFCRAILVRLPEARRSAKAFVEGLAVGLIAIALHSFADYSLHKPAIAVQAAALAGMAIAAVHLEKDRGKQKAAGNRTSSEITLQGRDSRHGPMSCSIMRLISILAIVFVGMGIVQACEGIRRSFALSRFDYARRQWQIERVKPTKTEWSVEGGLEDARLVRSLGGSVPDELKEVTDQCFRWALDERLSAENRIAAAEESFIAAVSLARSAPSDYLVWLWLARVEGLMGYWDEADRFLDRARELKPHGKDPSLFEDDE